MQPIDPALIRDILIAVVPALVAGYTAYRQWSDKQDFGRQISALQTRIAVLEVYITDHELPLPEVSPVSQKQQGAFNLKFPDRH